MNRVVVESPYKGDVERNTRYARACMADCFARGEAPFASHLLYTQEGVLDDDVPAERELGIEAGFSWSVVADLTAVYTNLGISEGMAAAIEIAFESGRIIEYRTLSDWHD